MLRSLSGIKKELKNTVLAWQNFKKLAKEAKAVYKIDKVALVNCEIFERYLESFHIL